MQTSLRPMLACSRPPTTTRRGIPHALRACACLLLPFVALPAQPAPTVGPGPVVSMGQPPRWLPYVAGSGVLGNGATDPGGRLLFGVHRPIGSPVIGFGLDGEVYLTAGGADATGGLRLLGAARAVNLSAGLDWDARARNAVLALSWATAIRRGGFLDGGTMLRVDWLPARDRPWAVGVTVPLAQPYAGRTRPRRMDVDLPAGPPPAASPASAARGAVPPASDSALAAVREAATLLRAYSSFFSEEGGRGLLDTRRAFRAIAERVRDSLVVTSARYPNGRGYEEVQRVYDAELARAFAAAVREVKAPEASLPGGRDGEAAGGEVVAARARAGLLDHVLLPYDTLFGRVKDHDDIGGLTSAAQASFARWLDDSSAVPAARRPAARAVHARWLDIVRDVHRRLHRQWDDSRRIWLPLQLALEPEEYDDQAEVDALLERAAGRQFADSNSLILLESTDIPLEFARSVLAARDYHVLWIHDFTGRHASGAIDRIGYQMVADVYFPALTRAVRRYDDTGRLTTYQLFLDAHYFATRDGARWMTFLESPLDAPIRLPPGNERPEAHLRARQGELRDAVAASTRLQGDAARAGGASWLPRTVKVHVSITQPSDFSFRSQHIVPPLPFIPDNLMRDHRKIAFYDLSVADPHRGALVMGGVGIGEGYFSPTWDDRGFVLRGPAALEARDAARRMLLLNGIADHDIPAVLRDSGGTAPRSATERDRSGDVRALQVHNETGFGRKQSSVARAMLYGLAPRGSVIIVPDPLWIGAEWAGMLAGAALRGCRVFVIAPTAATGPAPEGIVAAQMSDVLSRLLAIQDVFGAEIARAGGELRVGLYTAAEDVNDVAAQAREVRAGVERTPWLRELFPFDSATLAVLDSAPSWLERAGYRAVAPGRDLVPRAPKLHAKTQFVASPGALAALVRQPHWPDALRRALLARARQSSASRDRGGLAAAYDSVRLAEPVAAITSGYAAVRSPEERRRVSFYLTTGTQNQDTRGLMMDGEAMLVVSGVPAAAALFDFYSFMAKTTWITSDAELDRHLPPPGGLVRWLGRLARYVL